MPSGFKGVVDFVGYSSGQPGAPAPAAGFRGIADFVGYSSGLSGSVSSRAYFLPMLGVGSMLLFAVLVF